MLGFEAAQVAAALAMPPAEGGRREDADAAYDSAIAIAADPGVRAYLQARRDSPGQ